MKNMPEIGCIGEVATNWLYNVFKKCCQKTLETLV